MGLVAACVGLALAAGCVDSSSSVNVDEMPGVGSAAPPPSSNGTPEAGLASSKVPGLHVAVVALEAPAPIAAKDFARMSAALVDKIAALNQAELTFIHHSQASSIMGRPRGLAYGLLPSGLPQSEQDIKDIAAKAMDVAILSERLSEVAGRQEGGSDRAALSADAFAAIARTGYALVIDSQNLRQALLKGATGPAAEAIETMGQYGAQLWNNAVTDDDNKGNPFLAWAKGIAPAQVLSPNAVAQVQTGAGAGAGSSWVARSGSPASRVLTVPPATGPAPSLIDPKVVSALTTAEGQSDAGKAQSFAAQKLVGLGAKPSSADLTPARQMEVPSETVAVAGSTQSQAGNLPTFPAGSAAIVSGGEGGSDPFLQSLGLNGTDPPTDLGKSPVHDAPALVTLTISNVEIMSVNKRSNGSSSFEAESNVSFKVSWNTALASPQFTLTCNGGTANTVSQASGSLTLEAHSLMILYPGRIELFCQATTNNGRDLGNAAVAVLVGDPVEATQRVIQVETDSFNLNMTLTADAVGTTSVEQTRAAQTAAVDATSNAVATEVAGTASAEFKLTAAAVETMRASSAATTAPLAAATKFTPKVVDNVFHPGNVMGVSTNITLERGRMYRFTFGGRVNLIDPKRSVPANELPEHVNGVAVPASGVVVIEGTGGVGEISCGSGVPDPDDPGGYSITVEDLGPS